MFAAGSDSAVEVKNTGPAEAATPERLGRRARKCESS